jgi:hypothetical protein
VYHLTLDIIFKSSFYLSPVFNFPRLIYLEPIFEVKEFTVGYKFDVAKFWVYPTRADLLCISSMFKIGERKVLSTLIMRFQECYKQLIKCMYNLDNWEGLDAKYFDKCSQSSKTTITTYEKDYLEQNYGVIGSIDDTVLRTGAGCSPGKVSFLPFFIGDIQTKFVENFLHYMANKSGFATSNEITLLDVANTSAE